MRLAAASTRDRQAEVFRGDRVGTRSGGTGILGQEIVSVGSGSRRWLRKTLGSAFGPGVLSCPAPIPRFTDSRNAAGPDGGLIRADATG
ncbi:predicted protein [Streptomyces sp. AA4]|nr:predicted protein [Streptomyces sp. AA4]